MEITEIYIDSIKKQYRPKVYSLTPDTISLVKCKTVVTAFFNLQFTTFLHLALYVYFFKLCFQCTANGNRLRITETF